MINGAIQQVAADNNNLYNEALEEVVTMVSSIIATSISKSVNPA